MRNKNFSTVSFPQPFIDRVKKAAAEWPRKEYEKRLTVSGLIQKVVSEKLRKKEKQKII